jgi:type VI protein secretion system component Hcp
MKTRKSGKKLRKAKKLEPTKALRTQHSDFSIVRKVDAASPKLY